MRSFDGCVAYSRVEALLRLAAFLWNGHRGGKVPQFLPRRLRIKLLQPRPDSFRRAAGGRCLYTGQVTPCRGQNLAPELCLEHCRCFPLAACSELDVPASASCTERFDLPLVAFLHHGCSSSDAYRLLRIITAEAIQRLLESGRGRSLCQRFGQRLLSLY